MAKIAYILLCHKDPEGIIAQSERLTAAGDYVSIHFDQRAPREAFDRIRAITAAGVVSTFAGAGTPGSGDGTGTAARFRTPGAVAIDGAAGG